MGSYLSQIPPLLTPYIPNSILVWCSAHPYLITSTIVSTLAFFWIRKLFGEAGFFDPPPLPLQQSLLLDIDDPDIEQDGIAVFIPVIGKFNQIIKIQNSFRKIFPRLVPDLSFQQNSYLFTIIYDIPISQAPEVKAITGRLIPRKYFNQLAQAANVGENIDMEIETASFNQLFQTESTLPDNIQMRYFPPIQNALLSVTRGGSYLSYFNSFKSYISLVSEINTFWSKYSPFSSSNGLMVLFGPISNIYSFSLDPEHPLFDSRNIFPELEQGTMSIKSLYEINQSGFTPQISSTSKLLSQMEQESDPLVNISNGEESPPMLTNQPLEPELPQDF